MDALSDVLATLKIQSTVSSRLEARGRWALRFEGKEMQIKFGTVLEGSATLHVGGTRKPIAFHAGDFYLLTNSKPFTTASIPPGVEQDGTAVFRATRGPDGVVRIGDAVSGGKAGASAETALPVVLTSGVFRLEGEAGRLLLQHLPQLVQLRAGDPATAPLKSLLDLLRSEDDLARPGASVAQSSLATLLLVQALRIYLRSMPQPKGWLGAMADRRVGASLSAMHGDITQPWTVESLAREAGMSRTAFSTRFKELVGVAPLEYLTDWRMTVARKLLRADANPVASIAAQVGYQSDTAFSGAFKRLTGETPSGYRRGQLAVS